MKKKINNNKENKVNFLRILLLLENHQHLNLQERRHQFNLK
jgi:hypothetical protein